MFWLALCAPAHAVEVCAGEAGIGVRHGAEGALPIIKGLSYRAEDNSGVVFETTAATMGPDGLISFALAGPARDTATVTATLTHLPHGFSLDCKIAYAGPARAWNHYASGFRLDFGREITAVRTQPVTRWVKPTGARPWEVSGDTPYPATECQLRQVIFGDTALVMVSPEYDPDWIYGGAKERARLWRLTPPSKTDWVLQAKMTFLVVPTSDLDPDCLAAEAAGRPLALSITTDRVGNLFAPDEPISGQVRVVNVTETTQRCTVRVGACDYYGARLWDVGQDLELAPAQEQRFPMPQPPPPLRKRGIIFLSAELSWEGGESVARASLGILPDRRADDTRPESPFGMAAIIAAPQWYPDQPDMPTLLRLMERIGVRWLRGGWLPRGTEFTPERQEVVRTSIALLQTHGILPHAQINDTFPKPEDIASFQRSLAATLEHFGWVTPYIEIGNELNFGGVSARQYTEGMLGPIHQTMRKVFSQGKVMTMGLGGVQKDWLDEFVHAGGMELIDVLSVHPGCHPRAPEYWDGWRGWVFRSQMLDTMKAAREHGGKGVWITEAYAPTSPERSNVDLRTSADYLVRTYVCALALGVEVIEWYQCQDGVWFAARQEPTDVEYNFGIVYVDLTPKPAYIAYGTMTEQLEGARYQARLDLGADDLYGVRFLEDGQPLDVLWSYREKHETDLPWWPPENYAANSRRPGEPWEERWKASVTVALPAAGTVLVTDIMGNERAVEPEGGMVRLQLTGSPVYVRGLGELPRLPLFWPDID